jgi:hypothetical protein
MAFFKSSKFGSLPSLIKKTKPLKAAYMGWGFINYGVVQRLPLLWCVFSISVFNICNIPAQVFSA